jgi:hypothetical protein
MNLLGDLHVALACWPTGLLAGEAGSPAVGSRSSSGAGSPPRPSAVPDADYLRRLSGEGVTLLVPADSAAIGRVPAGAKVCVRVWPQRGERVVDPGRLPRQKSLVVVSLEKATGPRQIAEALKRIGWNRVHLDLVPCLSRGDEPAVWAFLEELQAAGGFEVRQMRAMLGDNLARL